MGNIEQLDVGVLQEITTQQAWHYKIIPFKISPEAISFYAQEGFHQEVREELELLFGKKVLLEYLAQDQITQALGRYYRRNEPAVHNSRSAVFALNGKKDFIESLIEEAEALGSSDIHVEPYEEKCRIRFRIDGVLIEKYAIPRDDFPGMVNKIKIRANLDIAERRLPQDGRITYRNTDRQFDIRVSTLPTLYGEKMVLRLLAGNDGHIDIRSLGIGENDLRQYLDGVNRPNGMVLISGPTGSGKTTTLYATIHLLNEISRNILTIEDPIEYTLEGINQVQLKESIGLDFASAMRTFLRQDPDIIMVGEIRDVNTASMAIRASLTGHLVLSTIHTNWAWGIVARLIDMGVPSYLLADTLNTVVAQRLIRVLCPVCKEKEAFNPGMLPKSFVAPFAVDGQFVPKGCEHCHYTGYRGRQGVYEVIPIDGDLAEMIKSKELKIKGLLGGKKIRLLSENAYSVFAEGKTSLKEIYPILQTVPY